MRIDLVILVTILGSLVCQAKAPDPMVRIPSGAYVPLYSKNALKVSVESFRLDAQAVTNAQFLAFIKQYPQWRKSQVKRVFAEKNYLNHWSGDLNEGNGNILNLPVVNISWFAAQAYCESKGKTLPTVDQWEYVASTDLRDTVVKMQLIEFWEWTLDFNTAMVSGESRGDSDVEKNLYCGGGAAGANDFKDYAAFMRYAFRSSLKAAYTTANLGFRCAKGKDQL